jgi:hypothetical protein
MFRLSSYSEYRDDSDPAYLGGKAINAPDGDSVEGTQYDNRFFNQVMGVFQSIMYDAYGEIDFSDHPDSIDNPEVLNALKAINAKITDALLLLIQQNRADIDAEISTRQNQYIQLLNLINSNSMRITVIENAVYSDIITNPFEITFQTLDGIELISGIWNEAYERIECTITSDNISIHFAESDNFTVLEGVYNTEEHKVEC